MTPAPERRVFRLTQHSCVILALLILSGCKPLFSPPAPQKHVRTTDAGKAGTDERAKEYVGELERVIDGDTIVMDNGEHVRYIGVNSSEVGHGRKPDDFYGPEATECNKDLLGGDSGVKLKLVFDKKKRDRYGRWLAYVYSGKKFKTFVNMELVRRGCAEEMRIPPDVKFSDEFESQADDAAGRKVGIWSAGRKR